MGSFNKVILIGNLTRDPELRYTPSGTAVSDIGVAVNEKRKDQAGNTVEEVVFVEVTLWGRTAEIASEFLSKGASVLIEGKLKLDTWEAPEGGKRSKLKVVCTQMQMMNNGTKNGAGANPKKVNAPEKPVSEPESDTSVDDEIPF